MSLLMSWDSSLLGSGNRRGCQAGARSDIVNETPYRRTIDEKHDDDDVPNDKGGAAILQVP